LTVLFVSILITCPAQCNLHCDFINLTFFFLILHLLVCVTNARTYYYYYYYYYYSVGSLF
jgi:hypothetical protein